MKTTDLFREMTAAVENVRQLHLDRMLALGVSSEAIASLGARQPPFGIGPVQHDGSNIYAPGDGPMHVIMPVIEEGGIVDLVAWRSSNPARWYWRTGAGWALGTACLIPRWDDEPLQLHATPLAWLAAGGEGLCILDWAAPEIRDLACCEAIEADEMVGRRLMTILSKPARVPRINYRRVAHHVAA